MDDIIPQVRPAQQVIRYPLSWRLAVGLVWSLCTLRRRSFAEDARRAVAELRPPLEVTGGEHVPATGPCLVTCNHYSRPGFQAWWLAFAITAAMAERRAPGAVDEVFWVMTAAWRFENSRWRQRFLAPLSRRAFVRVARVYGFVTMPPMPPVPEETEERAVAVLRTVRLARRLVRTGGLLALAPEGRDVPIGLAEPPPGLGLFVGLLAEAGMPLLPAAVSERSGRLRVSFGPVFRPGIPARRADRDVAIAGQVMAAIARLLRQEDRATGSSWRMVERLEAPSP
jgi:hypothetical protein